MKPACPAPGLPSTARGRGTKWGSFQHCKCHVLRSENLHVPLDQPRSSAGVLKQLKQGRFMRSKLLPRDTCGIIPRCCSPVTCGCFVGSLESGSLAGGLAKFINLCSFVKLITGTSVTFMKLVPFNRS